MALFGLGVLVVDARFCGPLGFAEETVRRCGDGLGVALLLIVIIAFVLSAAPAFRTRGGVR
jgi:hypothetical protein